MRNLTRLTNAANRIERGPRRIDRRKLLLCTELGCRRKVEVLPDGFIVHCNRHWTQEERERHFTAWRETP